MTIQDHHCETILGDNLFQNHFIFEIITRLSDLSSNMVDLFRISTKSSSFYFLCSCFSANTGSFWQSRRWMDTYILQMIQAASAQHSV